MPARATLALLLGLIAGCHNQYRPPEIYRYRDRAVRVDVFKGAVDVEVNPRDSKSTEVHVNWP
ncbi:MAG: hypothetical protein GXY44_03695 [Phycisphaerales bacterium]|nr:hypothetical protein [Phycisphaerales bacterium]